MILVFVPIGESVARMPQEWFLNTPVLWMGALVLIGLVRGPLRNAPALLKKPLKFAAASCVALGLIILLAWKPVLQQNRGSSGLTLLWFILMGLSSVGWLASFFWIFLARPKPRLAAAPALVGGSVQRPALKPLEAVRNVPAERFADVGGMDEAKEQIRQVVQGHLNPEKYKRYGLVRNGILLYGPRGTGKTFLARATAGEFGLN
ncbi:MAG TPA: AAA family ATPase, partial [Candidatus Angelobacter sp.]|nr:AAA family ATPase [Candidatus Angelobacter sp.]